MSLLLLLRNPPARVYVGPVPPGGFVNGPVVRATTGLPPETPYAPRLTLELLELDGTLVAELALAFARRFTDNLDGTGTGQFSVGMDDPDVDEIRYGRLARFFIDGQARLTMLLAAIDKVEIAPGEEVDQIVTAVGPSWFALLEAAIVAPGPGSPVDNPDVRAFGLSSPAGTGTVTVNGTPTSGAAIMPAPDPAPWPNPIAVEDPPPSPVNFPFDIPSDPIPVASWVTAYATSNDDPLHLLQTFDVVEADTPTRVDVGTSAAGAVYVDGVLVASPTDAPRAEFAATLKGLDVGTHTLLVVVDPPADDTPAAAITRVTQLDPDTGRHAITLITSNPAGPSSSSGAVRAANPPTSITAGRVMAVLIAEAIGRGCFPTLELGFDGSTDSAGEAWLPVEDFTVDVGTDTVASVAKKLTEAGYGWFRMAPGQFRLDGYADLPSDAVATLAAQVDLAELKHEGAG